MQRKGEGVTVYEFTCRRFLSFGVIYLVYVNMIILVHGALAPEPRSTCDLWRQQGGGIDVGEVNAC